MMKTLKTRVVMKNKNINASQIMNKMTKTMQKISQKMNDFQKKNSNIGKKNACRRTDTRFNESNRNQLSKHNEND